MCAMLHRQEGSFEVKKDCENFKLPTCLYDIVKQFLCISAGTTAERVCICGDSAGGNLSVALALRAIAMGIRVPDGILSAYGTFLVRYTPSPARIMALMDPLLPLGLMAQCLAGNILHFSILSRARPIWGVSVFSCLKRQRL